MQPLPAAMQLLPVSSMTTLIWFVAAISLHSHENPAVRGVHVQPESWNSSGTSITAALTPLIDWVLVRLMSTQNCAVVDRGLIPSPMPRSTRHGPQRHVALQVWPAAQPSCCPGGSHVSLPHTFPPPQTTG